MNLTLFSPILPWVKRCRIYLTKILSSAYRYLSASYDLSYGVGLVAFFFLLFCLFAVIFPYGILEGLGTATISLLSSSEKTVAIRLLGIAMGGSMLFLGLVIADRRAKAMEDSANAQAEANENVERGQRQERLKNAIEHLGHTSDSVRLGGAYELFHLAQDNEELRQTVLDILCAHIRGTTSESKYREIYKSEPSEEIQSLLNLLFVQEDDAQTFGGLHIDLRGSWLNGAKLYDARLQNAFLPQARLQEAELDRANLNGANLTSSKLQFANLTDTKLRAAKLIHTELHCTLLASAELQGARLDEAHFQGTILESTKLQGVSSLPEISNGFEHRLRKRINKETEINSVRFSGGLDQAEIDTLVNDLSQTAAEDARRRLTRHVSPSASHRLLEDRGANIGSFTKKEAEEWIAEYKEAMAETPGEDDS